MTDLRAELRYAARDVRQVHLDRMTSLGVSIPWMADCSTYPFGVAHCEPSGPGLYQPGQGILHVVLPVIEDGELVDLVAFRSSDPANWLLRTGNGWALGLANGMGKYRLDTPIHLYSDPLDWMRGRGEGLAILDWDDPSVRSLDVLPEITCSTPAVAAVLTRVLSRPVRLPQISLMEARDDA